MIRLPQLSVILLAVSRLCAQLDSPLPENPPDFSAAYAKFYDFGLHPLPENAFPVSTVHARERRGSLRYGWQHPVYQVLPLFAWESDTGELMLLSGEHVSDALGRLVSAPWETTSTSEGPVAVRRTEDLDVIFHDLFKTQIARPDPFRRPVPVSVWMILAVRMHEHGHTHLANQLTAWLFAQYGREAVLRMTVSDLISMQYAHLHRRVLLDHDLNRFVRDTEQFLEEFGAVWHHADQIREAVTLWKASLEFNPEAVFADRPEMVELLDVFRRKTMNPVPDSYPPVMAPGLLLPNLLNPAPHEDDNSHADNARSPFERLVREHGMGILPMLLELAEVPLVFPLNSYRRASPFDPFTERNALIRELRTARDAVAILLRHELPGLNEESSFEDARQHAMDLYERWRDLEPHQRVADAIPVLLSFYTLPPELPEAWARSPHPEIHEALRQRFLDHPVDLFRVPQAVVDSPIIQGEANAAYREMLAIELELAANQLHNHLGLNRMLMKLGRRPDNVEILPIEAVLARLKSEPPEGTFYGTIFKLDNGLIFLDPETSDPAHVQRVLLARMAESAGPELERLRRDALTILLSTPKMTHVPPGQHAWPLKEAWMPLLQREADPEIGPAPADVANMLLRTNRPAYSVASPLITNLEVTVGKDAADAFQVRLAINYLKHGILIPSSPYREAWSQILLQGTLEAVNELLATPDPMQHQALHAVIREHPYFFQREELREPLTTARRTLKWHHGDFPDGFPQVPIGTRIEQQHLQNWVDWAYAQAEDGKTGEILLTSSLLTPGLSLRHAELSNTHV